MENIKNFMQFYKMRKSQMDLIIGFSLRIKETFKSKFSIERHKETFENLKDIEWVQPHQERNSEPLHITSASKEGTDIHYIMSMDCSYKIINDDKIRNRNFLFYSTLTKNEQIMSDTRFNTKFTYNKFFDTKFNK